MLRPLILVTGASVALAVCAIAAAVAIERSAGPEQIAWILGSSPWVERWRSPSADASGDHARSIREVRRVAVTGGRASGSPAGRRPGGV